MLPELIPRDYREISLLILNKLERISRSLFLSFSRMISGGVEDNKFTQIRLMLEAKFGGDASRYQPPYPQKHHSLFLAKPPLKS